MLEIDAIISEYKKFSHRDITEDTLLENYLLQWTSYKEQCEEYFAKTYIQYTCDTQDQDKFQKYSEAIKKMEEISPIAQQIELKIIDHFRTYDKKWNYAIELIKNSVNLYEEKNLSLETKESELSQEYQKIVGSLTIEHEGKTIPLSMARPFLERPDRELRRIIFEKMSLSSFAHTESISKIFDKQVEIRDQIAANVKEKNYRDYTHKAKARLDYTPQDCIRFSDVIEEVITPMGTKLYQQKAHEMSLEALTPFDTTVDSLGQTPLAPAKNQDKFLEKCLAVLHKVSPEVEKTLATLNTNGQLDLFARMGKAPGGYNYPLSLSKTSFIFMNSSLTHQDAVTLFHETGHAYHFDLYKNQTEPFLYKSPSSEIAELASMSMELMAMEHWDILYTNKNDLKRAKRRQLEGIIHFFPWMAIVDSFQQWVYLNPSADIKDRNRYFTTLYKRFIPAISWDEYEQFLSTIWQKQLHIIEVPFYYIEYGIAQLGAIQIWKMYKKNPQKAFAQYKKALEMASKVPMSQAYKEANLKISFESEHIRELMDFVMRELEQL